MFCFLFFEVNKNIYKNKNKNKNKNKIKNQINRINSIKRSKRSKENKETGFKKQKNKYALIKKYSSLFEKRTK